MSVVPDAETLADRAAALPEGSVPTELDLALGVEVRGSGAHTLRFRDGRVTVLPGTEQATVTVVLDSEDAAAVAAGTTNVQHLLAAGRIRLRGDLGSVPAARAVAAIGPLLAAAERP